MQVVGVEAFQALITGSEGFATALRKALGSAILGEATLEALVSTPRRNGRVVSLPEAAAPCPPSA